jgi:hypothetical protein
MDRCPKCGNKLSSIDVLCPRCGALVEVVQVKKNPSVLSSSSQIDVPVKKQPPQSLVVYNDDMPSDESIPIPEAAETPAEPQFFGENLPEQTAPAPPPEVAADSTPLPDLSLPPAESDIGTEEDYLALFRKMKLPELEDISSGGDPSGEPASPPAIRRWLEIEEVMEEPPAAAPVSAPPASEAPDPPVSQPSTDVTVSADTQHRYRYHGDAKRVPQAVPRRSAGRVALMIFIWLLVTGLLFYGFFFADRYVKEHYGSYPAMLYEISNGNINLAPSAQPQAEVPSPSGA